jgi:serine/threonine-protein kinase
MVSGSFRCDPNRLKLLLDDRLPEQRQTELAEHIETCPACRRRLESLAADAELWGQVEQLLSPEPDAEPPASTLQNRGSPGGDGSHGTEVPAERQPPLDFLDPSGDPQKIGRLGPYEIVEVIGSGGMGVVLKGFESTLNRYVAIKVLAPHLASSAAARRRFAREAQAAAAVVHEHVIAIHAVDAAGDPPYLVMPFVNGQSLQARLDCDGPLELREILRIAAQTAAGLAAAHAQGLVHRDIKPANILLENGVERVMITDFGLARAIDDASLTQSGVVAGTPQYMSPEQADGKTVDHRADLFSLGSVIYAMCTGRSPFRAETTMAVLRRICEGAPRAIRQINPEIPEWLAEIVEKLHQKDPDDRFQSAAEVSGLLGRHLAHLQQPLTVPMPARLEVPSSLRRGRRQRRRYVSAAAAVLLFLVAAVGVGELTGTTRIGAGLARLLRRPKAVQPPETSRQARPPIPASGPSAATLADTDVSLDVLRLDRGFQEELREIRERVYRLQARFDAGESDRRSLDSLAELRSRLEALGEELHEGGQAESRELLSVIAARLDELEQESHGEPAPDRAVVDESLSEIGVHLEMLEQEARECWP